MRKIVLTLITSFLLSSSALLAVNQSFSTSGFYSVNGSEREVMNFNVGWRFNLGDVAGAEKADFNDSEWQLVSTPHTVQLVPAAASGGRNYQGIAWYRKHFNVAPEYKGQKMWLHFEAIMGKSKIYIDGKLVKENFGGFLPIIIDLSKIGIDLSKPHVVSVCADNSDDPSYPPGKPQGMLDFCYFGGIYRDCWLYTTSPVHVTDANYAAQQANGGVFVSYDKVSTAEAIVRVSTHLINESDQAQKIDLISTLVDKQGKIAGTIKTSLQLAAGENKQFTQLIKVKNPALWHPDAPNLYQLKTTLLCNKKTCDALITRVGIRSIEFRANEGLFINGKRFEDKLLGVNRHQDFGYIGMAMTNGLHYADVKKMRDAGIRVIRSAHYPQDPAFVDACDELGMFLLVATPGWQFWDKKPLFEERVLSDIRNMVRRDRNHPCVLLWEPILNETHYPDDFAKKAHNAVHQEYPFAGCYTACDDVSRGNEYFDVIFTAPKSADFYKKLGKCCFTREFGDCVDDWYSHNSYSRVSRAWGEAGLIQQAQHYAKKDYEGSLTIDQLYQSPAAHIGGALWHSFDHQRGYHPDPFWGGIMDAFRQPKYSYYMFQSQRDARLKLPQADSGPMVYIANAMTPLSPTDVVVYSNCDSVRLTTMVLKNSEKMGVNVEAPQKPIYQQETQVLPVIKGKPGLPNSPVIFKDAYNFVTVRAMHRSGKMKEVKMIAEGILDGKIVATQTQIPSKRSDFIRLKVDNQGVDPQANGSDIVMVIASIVDERGYVRQLAMEEIEFTVEGEGEIIGNSEIGANPCKVEQGTAQLLIRTSTKAGKVKVTARILHSGINTAAPDSLTFETAPTKLTLNYTELPSLNNSSKTQKRFMATEMDDRERRRELNKKVEQDQQFFESTERIK